MGRPYHSEIQALPETYAWARETELGALRSVVDRVAAGPVVVVGSGGSLSAARLVASFHECATGHVARAVTPLEFAGGGAFSPETSVLLMTAGGSNSDILRALSQAQQSEPREVVAVVMKAGSRAARVGREADDRTSVFEFPVPFGKDGYLATNSLLGAGVLLARAYFPQRRLADTLVELLGVDSMDSHRLEVGAQAAACFTRRFLIVLHDRQSAVGASDIETRCSEAGLAAVQVADLRNFGHGRHQWLARHGADTAILSMQCDENRSLARRTLALVPEEIPRGELEVPTASPDAELVSLMHSIVVGGVAGDELGLDPGRPHVPVFGRKLYGLKAARRRNRPGQGVVDRWASRRGVHELGELRERLDAEQRRSLEGLTTTAFGGLVLDYDGTLVSKAEKQTGPRAEVVAELQRLLELGISIGIATGRGRSVRADLRKSLPKEHWPRVLVGYYNGSQLGPLDDDKKPSRDDHLTPELQQVYDAMMDHVVLTNSCQLTRRGAQLTVEVQRCDYAQLVREAVSTIAARIPNVRVVCSSHSLDVIAASVSKTAVVRTLEETVDVGLEVLCIGDKGTYPGNDFDLLQHPFSLSVDEESPMTDRGWRIAPRGERGVAALLRYLRALVLAGRPGGVELRWEAQP